MAVNNSGGPPVNSLVDDDHFGLSDLGRIRDQYHTEPASIRAARLRGEQAQQHLSHLETMEATVPGSLTLPTFKKQYLRATRTQDNVNSRLSIYEESKQDRLNEQVTNMVGRQFSTSAVNSYVAQNTNTLGAQVAGASMTGQGYGALSMQRSQIMNQMQGLRESSMAAAGSYIAQGGINPNSASMLQSGSDQMKDLAKQLIPITLAMQQLKQQGMDPKGRQEELSRIGNRAAGVLHSNQLQEDMRSGTGLGALSSSELKKKEADAAEKLIKALTALNNAAGKTTDELNALNKEAEEAAKEFSEANEAKGAKGDDGGNKYETIKMIAGTVMQVLDIGANAMQNVAINQPMQMVANTAASANMENEKYTSWHAALAGNMHERQNLDWSQAQAFGNNLANNQDKIHAIRQANYGIGAGLGTGQVILAGAGAMGSVVGINTVETVAQGSLNVASGGAGLVVDLADQQRQITKTALRVEGAKAFKNAQKALTKISGTQLQTYRDYTMGINQTAGAMGGEVGEAFLNETGSADFLMKLSDAGIGTKEFAQLSSQGVEQMGSRFDKGQIFKSVEYEEQGYGTAEQNMQRIGMLAAAGTGDSAGNLGKIIEDAMQRGLNSSKALDMIVQNTAKLGEEALMAGAATDPSTSISNAILRATQQGTGNDELALKLAQRGYERGEGARRNISASLPGLLNVDRAMNDFGVDRRSAMLMANMSSADVDALKGMDAKGKRGWFENQGMNLSGMDSSWLEGDKLVDRLNYNAAVAVGGGQTGVGYVTGDPGAFAAELASYKGKEDKDSKAIVHAMVFGDDPNNPKLSDRQRQLRLDQAAASRMTGANPIEDAAKIGVLTGALDEKDAAKTLSAQNVNSRRNLVDEDRQGRRAQAAQGAAGATALGPDAKTAISALAESGRQAFQMMGKDALKVEQAWAKAAEATAKNFGDSTTLMDGAAVSLTSSAKAMAESTQLMAASGADFASAVSAAITEIRGKLGSIAEKKTEPTALERRRFENLNNPKTPKVLTNKQ